MKLLSIFKWVLLGICVVSLIPVAINGDAGVDFILIWAAVLLGLAILSAVVFPLINIGQNPKGAMRSLIGLAAVAIVLGICYALSSTDPIAGSAANKVFDDPTELKVADTGLYAMYFAMAGAILAVLFGEIRNAFK